MVTQKKDSDIEIEINSDAQVFANLEGMAYKLSMKNL